MAAPEPGAKDEIKTQFATREGTYRLISLGEYARPNRVGPSAGGAAVRVSLVSLPDTAEESPDERICFNHGKELYVYVYRGVKKPADLTKPVDKKMYKSTNPTCHDFNAVTAGPDGLSLIIGFSTGQIQLIDPVKKELSKLYNEERMIEKSRVTCVRWVPGSRSQFVAAHASGQLYVYDEGLPCAAPQYAPARAGPGYSVHAARQKARNPLARWALPAAVNEFAFSPDGDHLAVATQDGFLRVFHFERMELVGRARSYFGGFLCVCWSPDSKYVVVGGEDDLVTVWSFGERRVVARGQGHRSWVSVVAFDPFAADERADCYRLGSVSQDTQLCLWELSADVLRAGRRGPASPPLPPAPTDGSGRRRAARARPFPFGERRDRRPEPAPPDDADALRLIGTAACPRFDQCPVLEPLVCKKIAAERLTALVFRADCVLTACADGAVSTWARPLQRPRPAA